MEKINYVLAGAITLFVLSLMSAVIAFNYKSTALSPVSALEECKSLSYSSPSALNLLFFSDKETAKKYSDYLLTISPYKENKDSLNFYYVDSYQPSCELYKNVAILCYSKSLIAKAASFPHDIIIAFNNNQQEIRSSSYLSVISINKNHPLSVFPHEMGHALAHLAEEYVPASLPSKQENCLSECSQFSSQDSCFQGCSNSDLKRSIDSGIMRSLDSNTYGEYDESIILKYLLKNKQTAITGNAVNIEEQCKNDKYYLIEAQYNSEKNKIQVLNKELRDGCPGTSSFGDFSYNIISTQGIPIDISAFDPVSIFTDSQLETQETIEGALFENTEPFFLTVPFIENAKSIEIEKNNNVLASIQLNSNIPCQI